MHSLICDIVVAKYLMYCKDYNAHSHVSDEICGNPVVCSACYCGNMAVMAVSV